MPLHDLQCIGKHRDYKGCGWTRTDYRVMNGYYPPCPVCGGFTNWRPFVLKTDVCGEEKTAPMLKDEFGRTLTYRSSRERDAKMKRMGYEPAGDKQGGARNEDVYKQRSVSYSGQNHRSTPREPMKLRG